MGALKWHRGGKAVMAWLFFFSFCPHGAFGGARLTVWAFLLWLDKIAGNADIAGTLTGLKFAHFITWWEWLHLFDDLPFDVEVVVFFYFEMWSLSVVEVLLCSNLKDVYANWICLKFVFCLSDIPFLVVRSCFCYCCFIYNALSEALAAN